MICPKCEKSFGQIHLLRDHITVVHEGIIPYVCPQCGKGFVTDHGQPYILVHYVYWYYQCIGIIIGIYWHNYIGINTII